MSSSTFLKIVAVCLMSLAGSFAVGPSAVNLGGAGNFAILAESGVSTVPSSLITGNVGLSPAASTALTGWSLTRSADGTSASSTQDTGLLMAADFTSPTPSTLTTAISSMITAFNDASGRLNPTGTNLGTGAIGGLTFTGGVYKWTSSVTIGSPITLVGTPTDTWIFQIAGTLAVANGTSVVIVGGGLPKNIVWAVSGAVTLGSTSSIDGVIIGGKSISLGTGASVNGRLLAQTAVTLQKSTVIAPAASVL